MHSPAPFDAPRHDETIDQVACRFYKRRQEHSTSLLTSHPLSTITMPPKGMRAPISTLKGTWTRILDTDRLRRSSQVVSVIDQTVCIFGGEVQPRQPIDDKVDILSLKPGNNPHCIFTNMVLRLNLIQTRQTSRLNRFLKHPVLV